MLSLSREKEKISQDNIRLSITCFQSEAMVYRTKISCTYLSSDNSHACLKCHSELNQQERPLPIIPFLKSVVGATIFTCLLMVIQIWLS